MLSASFKVPETFWHVFGTWFIKGLAKSGGVILLGVGVY